MHNSCVVQRKQTVRNLQHFLRASLSAVALLLIPVGTLSAQESGFQESGFRLQVSGLLADKLALDTQLYFWTPFCDSPEGLTVGMDELSILLPFSQFEGHHWHVLFSSKATRSSFSGANGVRSERGQCIFDRAGQAPGGRATKGEDCAATASWRGG